ncbi:MAG: urease accessory UreF family protein [Luteolibacter sp.]|uniref:urease accessory protein UreF n=1 Tax=Luteolibacter sp. TaxID=1962973 RepID=UPI003266483E
MSADPTLWLLQANDTAYPSGSYAHSFGLEELVESGVVRSAQDLENFIEKQILPALLIFEIPLFARSHAAVNSGDSKAMLEIDQELDAWRIPAELRDASRRIGSQRLDLLAQLDPSPLVLRYRELSPRSHHLVVTALELSSLPVSQAARAFAFQAIVALTAASMKLMRIGQTSCQLIARRSLVKLGEKIDDSLSQPVDGWFNPLIEIASLRHARANHRLFIS